MKDSIQHRQNVALLAFECSTKFGINVDRTAFLVFIDSSIRTNSFQKVVEIVEKMVNQGVSLATHLNSLLISRLGCKKEFVSAVKVLNLLPDPEKCTSEFCCHNRFLLLSGIVDKGLETSEITKIKGVTVALRTYCVLVTSLEKCGRVWELEYYGEEKKRLQSRKEVF